MIIPFTQAAVETALRSREFPVPLSDVQIVTSPIVAMQHVMLRRHDKRDGERAWLVGLNPHTKDAVLRQYPAYDFRHCIVLFPFGDLEQRPVVPDPPARIAMNLEVSALRDLVRLMLERTQMCPICLEETKHLDGCAAGQAMRGEWVHLART